MYTIGVDITTVSRVKKSCEKESFRNHVFSHGELEMFFNREKPKFSSLAANFAAKEAFSKSIGTGIRYFNLNEVEVLRDAQGAPYFNFYGRAAQIVLEKGYRFQLSLSHEGDTAIAMVLAERDESAANMKNL